MIKGHEKFYGDMNKMDHTYPIVPEVSNFDFIITAINVSALIVYPMKTLLGEAYFFIVSNGKILQTIAHVFMLPHEFNASLLDYSLLLYHLIAMKMDDFDFIMATINATNLSTVQNDHCYVFLIVIIHELLMIAVDTLELFFLVFYNNFCINSDKNWSFYTLLHELWIIKTILLTMIVITCEFYVIVWILMYLHVQINNTMTFKCASNDTTNTVQSGSNDGQTTVQRGSKVGATRVKYAQYTTPPTNVSKIIDMITVYEHNDNIFNKNSYAWTHWIMISAIHNSHTHQLHTNSSILIMDCSNIELF